MCEHLRPPRRMPRHVCFKYMRKQAARVCACFIFSLINSKACGQDRILYNSCCAFVATAAFLSTSTTIPPHTLAHSKYCERLCERAIPELDEAATRTQLFKFNKLAPPPPTVSLRSGGDSSAPASPKNLPRHPRPATLQLNPRPDRTSVARSAVDVSLKSYTYFA